MKIIIIARGYPTDKYKMNGIFEFDQARALVEAGVKVVYLAIDVRSIRRWRKWGYDSFIKEGVQIEAINIPCGRVPRFMLDKIKEISLSKLYKKIFRKYGKPDIIHSHFIGMGYISAEIFKNSKVHLVHTEHYSGMNQDHLSVYYQNLGNNTYKNMDKVIAVSSHLANNISDKFGIKPVIIPNIVDTSIFKCTENDYSNEEFNFICVGNLLENKRMDLLITSFNEAFKANIKVKLYIYGEGSERKNLEKLIDEFCLAGQVFLMGLVDRLTIANKMQRCHCFVLPSRSETFGVAYIEAMAAGLPVIATKCGGPEDFVNESNGILIPVDNKDALINAMNYIYNNTDTYDRNKISFETMMKFSPYNIANKLIVEYNNILDD